MKTDTHSHIMLAPFYGYAPTEPELLLANLEQCGLDACWVSSVDSLVTHDLGRQQRANDRLADVAREHPGRIEAFCTVEPAAMEAAAREVERCVRELGLIGVKLHPWLQAFSVTHPGVELIMAAADSLRVPVLFHDGTPPYATPRQIAWLAERHPDVAVILGHAGLADLWRDAADAARRQPNLWLQPTAAPVAAIRAAVDAVGPERVLLGTDGGFGSAAIMRYVIAKYRAALGDELFERVAADSPQRLRAGAVESGRR